MKGKDLFDGMNLIDEEIIQEAETLSENKRKVIPWKVIAGIVAAACLVFVLWNVTNAGRDRKHIDKEITTMASNSQEVIKDSSVATELETDSNKEIAYIEKKDRLIVASYQTPSGDIRDIIQMEGREDSALVPDAGKVNLSTHLIYAEIEMSKRYRDNIDKRKEALFLVSFEFFIQGTERMNPVTGDELRTLYEKYNEMEEYELIWIEEGEKAVNGQTYIHGNMLFGLLTEEQIHNFEVEEPYSCSLFLATYKQFEWMQGE